MSREQLEWRSQLRPEVGHVAGGKRLPALREVLTKLGYDDMDGITVWEEGASTVGHHTPCSVFPQLQLADSVKVPQAVLKHRSHWREV